MLLSLKFLLDSIAWAAAIGLMSMGLTLTYLTTKVPNFAHATIGFMAAPITVYIVDHYYLARGKLHGDYLMYLYIVVISFIAIGALSTVIYLTILRPLARRGSDVISLMIATFAIDIILVSILAIILNNMDTVVLTRALDAQVSGYQPKIRVGRYIVQAHTLILPLVAIILAFLFHLFLTKTKFGVAMRATIENPSLASTLGVNVDLVYTVSWFISGGLAGVAGAFMTYMLAANPKYSALIIVSVFAGSIVGGLSDVYWGLIGGFIVGFSEKIITNIAGAVVGVPLTNYERMVSLVLVILVLLFAPQGLAGVDWGKLLDRIRGGR